ncbi:MAG: hypothetical protein AB7K71_33240 [Polyangiaceae bacterium]
MKAPNEQPALLLVAPAMCCLSKSSTSSLLSSFQNLASLGSVGLQCPVASGGSAELAESARCVAPLELGAAEAEGAGADAAATAAC